MDDGIMERFAEGLAGKSAEEIEALALVSPAVHFACYVTIRDKSNETIQPVPNVLQLRMSEAYETLRGLGVRVRIIVVKPRRAGCSSFASHILYHHGQRFPCRGITISDDKASSAELMGKLTGYGRVDSFPWGNAQVKRTANGLAWSNGTRWTVDTAQNPDAGVGETLQLAHFSEVSKWPQTPTRNDKKVMAAVLPALSGEGTVAIAESTPERASGWQHETWRGALGLGEFLELWEKGFRPEEQWIKVFAAWYEFGDNRRTRRVEAAEVEAMRAGLTGREREGMRRYGWTWEQVAWRRDTLANVCNGDEKIFDFYYPEDEFSCWLAGGTPRFDMAALVGMENRARGVTPETGDLVTQDTGVVVFQGCGDGTGEIWMWERPREGMRYLVAIDPASDETQTIGADPDRHSVNVWRAGYHEPVTDRYMPARKVARVRPPYYADGDEVAAHGVRLSKFYGRAIVAIEVNCGLDILRLVTAAGVPVYKRRPLSHRTGRIEEIRGYRTGDKQERNALVEGFAAAIRAREVEVHCLHSIGEYKSFIITAKGRAQAAPGAHDDDVMADAIAWETLPSATEYRRHEVRLADPRDGESWRKVVRRW